MSFRIFQFIVIHPVKGFGIVNKAERDVFLELSGMLLVTPNNIMFDPHKTDPLVQKKGHEEYGIM